MSGEQLYYLVFVNKSIHVFSAPLDCESVVALEKCVELLKDNSFATAILAACLYQRLEYDTDKEPVLVATETDEIDVANVISAESVREWTYEDSTDSFVVHGAKVRIFVIADD